jgi:long-chain fatty acid transport protein
MLPGADLPLPSTGRGIEGEGWSSQGAAAKLKRLVIPTPHPGPLPVEERGRPAGALVMFDWLKSEMRPIRREFTGTDGTLRSLALGLIAIPRLCLSLPRMKSAATRARNRLQMPPLGRARIPMPLAVLARLFLVWLAWIVVAQISVHADGIYRNGIGARAMSLGGASVAWPDEPLDAMSANPAGLGLTNGAMLQLGGWGAVAGGEFSKTGRDRSKLEGTLGLAPEAAVSFPLKSVPVTFGLGVMADSVASLDWRFVDPPGGVNGTSYGLQQHHAEIIAIRTALGASVALSDSVSVGATLGIVYNRNTLEAPYVFQSHPALRGLKTLLDLETEGWGVNGNVGLVYRPHQTVSIGLTYRTPTELNTDGNASGNVGAQFQTLGPPFDTLRRDFRYDARVKTALPQSASAGVSWQFHPRARAIVQVDWINWSDSFDQLDITLTRGNNADLNAFLQSDRIKDTVPLNWRDRFVYRAGLEFSAAESWLLRAGYAYGGNPVPDSTLTPMSAAILEHTVTAGLEWRRAHCSIAAAYQYDFPSESAVGASALRSGEFSNSRTRLDAHWFGITTGLRF